MTVAAVLDAELELELELVAVPVDVVAVTPVVAYCPARVLAHLRRAPHVVRRRSNQFAVTAA